MARVFLPAILLVLIVGGGMFVFISRQAKPLPAPAAATVSEDDAYADLDADLLFEDDLLLETEVTDEDIALEEDATLDASEAALSEIQVDAEARPRPTSDAGTDAPVQTVRATVLADDVHFAPAEVRVPRGTRIELTFQVAEEQVYFGGLSIRSAVFNTGPIAKGTSKTVTFTVEQGFTFSSYWPSSGVKKADGQVIVE